MLSPGPGRPADFDCDKLLSALDERGLPVFGVCLGLQAMVEHAGGSLGLLDTPVHGKPGRVRVLGGALLAGLPAEFTAARYHSLHARPEQVTGGFEVTAVTADGVVMAIEDADARAVGRPVPPGVDPDHRRGRRAPDHRQRAAAVPGCANARAKREHMTLFDACPTLAFRSPMAPGPAISPCRLPRLARGLPSWSSTRPSALTTTSAPRRTSSPRAGTWPWRPDLFEGKSWIRCIRSAFGQLRAGRGPAFAALDAARAFLAARPDCTGKTGVIGFCLGGGFALLCAPRPGFDVAAVNYGDVPKDAESVLAGACPVVGSFGGRDLMGTQHPERLGARSRSSRCHTTCTSTRAPGHRFMTESSGVGAVFARIGKMSYQPEDAADAWQRIFAFFGTSPGTASGPAP